MASSPTHDPSTSLHAGTSLSSTSKTPAPPTDNAAPLNPASPTLAERARGAIYGVCCCDALGAPVMTDFTADKTKHKPITLAENYRPVTLFNAPPGSFTDDGSMTLALATSFIADNGKYSRSTVIENFKAWYFDGKYSSLDYAFDIGGSTSTAMRTWGERVDASDQTQEKVDEALNIERCSGNGSLMRCVPVGLVMHTRPLKEAQRVAREQSDLTHPYSRCADACSLYTALVVGVMKGKSKQELFDFISDFDISDRCLRKNIAKYTTIASWATNYPGLNHYGYCGGEVATTLETALFGFFTTDNFADGALKVVNSGGDTDTAGAVYGGLAGAFYGYDAIPDHWVKGLQRSDLIKDVASKLGKLAEM
ncbi:hypothetical protein FH972_022648 [Carpinus fangiana]|uniref:ADP-ribosylhydrolase ARH3 n=1 Tax=Carpinus fangiana TaxID=176857 RepID=A0A5N6KSU8_9ROSI|nr:hypothetical protein FH972_022648 [Carpinus fangiana]